MLALPIAQLLVILGRLGVDEVGLQSVPVALQERVRQRAVAPPDAVPVQVNEENSEGIEEAPREPARRCGAGGAEESSILNAAAQIVGDDEALAITAVNGANGCHGWHPRSFKVAQNGELALDQWRGELLDGQESPGHAHEAHKVA